jgi:predicted P-loop ATPase
LNNDRQIVISTGNSRKDLNWKRQTLKVSELYEKLRIPNRGVETLDEYMRMSKSKQDDLKDVGGFVAGSLNGGRRKANNVTGRDVITLDFDSVPALGTDNIVKTLDSMQINYCVYSTRKHAANAPRLRVLVPTDRTMTADEYEPCARRMAANIGIAMADPTTFEAGRLMYWPSVCCDSEYVFKTADAPFISVDALLKSYTDWHDFTQWPQVPGSFSYAKLAVKQGDPEAKDGIVGAFCRKYDVFRAIEELLPGIYAPVDTDPNRYTYTLGSTTGGAVIYDDGKFLFSHHATDPCSNKLVNAFDLVRLHKFGDKDDNAPDGTPNNRLPSYKAMCEYANGLDEVALEMLAKRQAQAEADFAGIVGGGPGSVAIDTGIGQFVSGSDGEATLAGAGDTADGNWQLLLKRNHQTGEIKNTIDNVMLILEHDPRIRGKFALNEFTGRGEILDVLPWSTGGKETRRMWSDTDSNALYWWMEKTWGITGRGNIDSALDIHAKLHAFNPVVDYLTGIKWDRRPRLDTLFIDYLGAEDTPYTRAVTRKAFTAAVARAMTPGCKYDNMLILCGPQGIGKSTILDKMSHGWFNDSIRTFEGKEASELLQGVWIIEVAELDAFRRTDVSCIKQFLSLTSDRYRQAYGRNVTEFKRRCVFFGTCNNIDFLQDTTGNRRFWPVDTRAQMPTKDVFTDLTSDEIDQVWAEAYFRFITGEQIFLSGDTAEAAMVKQEAHRERSIQEGVIAEFVARKIPDDWAKWPVDRRRDFWAGGVKAEDASINLVDRQTICAAEVWRELYGHPMDEKAKKSETREINSILASIPGWKNAGVIYIPQHGAQRGFIRA